MATYDVNCAACPGLYYVHPDLMGNGILGTSRSQAKIFDRFFAPFGEVYANYNYASLTATLFTGVTQDLDANLYDFEYREQSPVQGRWLNPDPSGISAVRLGDPQTLNRYAYVRGSAMSFTDEGGLGMNNTGQMNLSIGDGEGMSDFIVPECGICGYVPETYIYTISAGKAQSQKYTATILGQNVPVSITSGTPDEQKAIRGRLDAAIDDINQHASQLSDSDIQTIHNVKSITVDDSQRTGIDAKTGIYNMKSTYVMNQNNNTAWLASTVAHDAYHVTQYQRGEVYNQQTAPRLEHEANQFQMRVGATFGLAQYQLDFLKTDTHTVYNTPPY